MFGESKQITTGPGKWICWIVRTQYTYQYQDTKEISVTTENTQLLNIRENYCPREWQKLEGCVWVDSGRVGIYDSRFYKNIPDHSVWYDSIKDITNNQYNVGLWSDGIISDSGPGDGCSGIHIGIQRNCGSRIRSLQ